jgi:hypothetical protein
MILNSYYSLTKPDLVDKGAEASIIDLVQDRCEPKLRLGYCIVRNRGQQELDQHSSKADRINMERMCFEKAPWAIIEKDRVGVDSLKFRLQEILQKITEKEMPNVRKEIHSRLSTCKKELGHLGLDRSTPEEQRRYLQQMASEFQKITDHALDTYYERNDVFDTIPALRLPTLIVDLNDKFSDDICKHGHSLAFQKLGDDSNEGTNEDGQSEIGDEKHMEVISKLEFMTTMSLSSRGSYISDGPLGGYFQLMELFEDEWSPPAIDKTNIIEWIEIEYRKSRGGGLETISPAVLPALWKKQSANWEGFSTMYMKDVVQAVHNFIIQLVKVVCPDERTCEKLMANLLDPLLERYKKAIDHVKFIVKIERYGKLMTLNQYYNKNLQKFRHARLHNEMEKVAVNIKDVLHLRLDDIVKSVAMGNTEHVVADIHAILKAYYKVARKRFVDTVCMQGTDFFLLGDNDGPLRIFSVDFVSQLSNKQLENIAGEESTARRRRQALNSEIKKLEEGVKLLRLS